MNSTDNQANDINNGQINDNLNNNLNGNLNGNLNDSQDMSRPMSIEVLNETYNKFLNNKDQELEQAIDNISVAANNTLNDTNKKILLGSIVGMGVIVGTLAIFGLTKWWNDQN